MRIVHTLLAATLISTAVTVEVAAQPDTLWTRTFGGQREDIAYSVIQAADSTFAVLGLTKSFGAGNSDFWLVKIDPDGNEIWARTFGGADLDEGYHVHQTLDNGFMLAGDTRSFGAGGTDMMLVKTDPSGNEEWKKAFGGSGGENAAAALQTSNGNYILGGTTDSFGHGGKDFVLIRVDSTGNEIWTKTYGGSDDEVCHDLQRTSDGGYAMLGSTRSFGAGDTDFFLLKTDHQGNELWKKAFGGPLREVGNSLRQTSDGGFILLGLTESFGEGGSDFALIKTDSLGNQSWIRTHGQAYDDEGYCVRESSEGGYILFGSTMSYGSEIWDYLLVRTNDRGAEMWHQTYGGSLPDVGFSAEETLNKGYILAGGSLTYGAGNFDFWIIRVKKDPTGIEDGSPGAPGPSIPKAPLLHQNHPNPFNPMTVIGYSLAGETGVKLKIYDISGRLVRTLLDRTDRAGSHAVTWDGRDDRGLPVGSGIYIYTLEAGNTKQSRKMVLLK